MRENEMIYFRNQILILGNDILFWATEKCKCNDIGTFSFELFKVDLAISLSSQAKAQNVHVESQQCDSTHVFKWRRFPSAQ